MLCGGSPFKGRGASQTGMYTIPYTAIQRGGGKTQHETPGSAQHKYVFTPLSCNCFTFNSLFPIHYSLIIISRGGLYGRDGVLS
jgi:hypothetical protein